MVVGLHSGNATVRPSRWTVSVNVVAPRGQLPPSKPVNLAALSIVKDSAIGQYVMTENKRPAIMAGTLHYLATDQLYVLRTTEAEAIQLTGVTDHRGLQSLVGSQVMVVGEWNEESKTLEVRRVERIGG